MATRQDIINALNAALDQLPLIDAESAALLCKPSMMEFTQDQLKDYTFDLLWARLEKLDLIPPDEEDEEPRPVAKRRLLDKPTQRLISQAAAAAEYFTEDELEAHAVSFSNMNHQFIKAHTLSDQKNYQEAIKAYELAASMADQLGALGAATQARQTIEVIKTFGKG